MGRIKSWIFGVLLAVMLAGGALAGDLQKGLDAFKAGDYATALAEWTPLAEAGNPHAQYFLGLMYGTGDGVPQDYQLAYMWYNLVAAQGIEEGKKARDIVASSMSSEQIAEAQEMSRRCLKQNYKNCEQLAP